MRSSLVLLLSAAAPSSAFSPASPLPSAPARRADDTALGMSSPVKVPITIAGSNIELTGALTDYVNEKVDRTLGKLSSVSGASNCDVFLTVNKNPKSSSATAEVVTSIKGTTFRVAETSPDMYASIDLVASRLVSFRHPDVRTTASIVFPIRISHNRRVCPTRDLFFSQGRKLRKYKERRLNGYHGGPKMGENLADALNALEETEEDAAASAAEEGEEDFVDPEQAVVTKVKR